MFHVKHLIEKELILTDEQADRFNQFYQDVVEKNKVMNLTGITDEKEFHVKHFLDSLMLIKAVPDLGDKNYRIIDIGSGAGFPGIPLAIAFPNIQFTLMDSLEKRINFINAEIEKLNLKNVEAIHARAEDLARDKKYRENFDFAVSRAVANLSTLSEYSLPFVHIGGGFLPYKSGDVEGEIEGAKRALAELGGELKSVVKFSLPEDFGDRSIVVINKVKNTPQRYPRKSGTPTKTPL